MSRTRISRTLIALLVVTIALGLVAYFRSPNRTRTGEPAKPNPAVTQAPVVLTSAVAPATRPAAPATRPVTAGPVARPGQIALGNAASSAIVTQTPGEAGRTETPKPAANAVASAIPAAGANSTVKTPPAAPKPADASAEKAVAKVAEKVAAPARSTGNALADGKALLDANNLIGARKVLNEALVGGSLSAADAQAARELIAKANQTLVFSPRRAADDPYSGSYTVQPGDKPLKIAASHDVTWEFLARLNNISDPRKLRAGATLKVVRGPFHAVVSKSKFTLDLYLGSPGEQGSMYVCTYRVGTGKHNSTPTGTWMVTPQSKLKNPKWWGTADEPAREAGDPLNPLGKFWIGLQGTDGDAVGKNGYGIHGTIEPDTIGKEASHGCIRLVNEDVERVFEMLVEGKSTVIIKE